MLCAAVASLVAGTISVAPRDGCPAAEAIADELTRLGALAALAQVGEAEVESDGRELHIAIRDRQGIVLGSRAMEAPPDCSARAALAAVLIAAWTGDWIKTNLGGSGPGRAADSLTPVGPQNAPVRMPAPPVPAVPPAPPAPAVPPAPPAPVFSPALPAPVFSPAPPAPALSPSRRASRTTSAVARPAPLVAVTPAPAPREPVLPDPAPLATSQRQQPASPASAPVRLELAVLGFGLHDGDAGTYGGGIEGSLGRRSLRLVAVVEGAGERQRPLGEGRAGYSFVRMGLGMGVRKSWQRVFVDVTLVPELARHALRGVGLVESHSLTAWGFVADGRVRLGWRFGRVAPFLYLGASWSLLREQLRVDDSPHPIVLTRANLAAGLGISFAAR